jgi:hypothetical protein
MNKFILSIIILSVSGFAAASDQFIRITTPGENDSVDFTRPIPVSGSGKGLFEGNMVLRIEDLEGRQLAQAVTTMQRHDIAAEGRWQTRITLPQPAPQNIRLIAFSPSPKEGDAAITSAPVLLGATGQTALELGRKVFAVREAIQNPGMPNAMQAVTDLGHDQRYYVMVRGWLSYQLQGDMSILDANREQTRDEVRARINFLEKAIRAIDLE